jgi:hypothetical protein
MENDNDHDRFQDCYSRAGLGAGGGRCRYAALAKDRDTRRGHAARAKASPGDIGDGTMSGHRASAIRECSAKAAPFSQTTWGNVSSDQYRACMAEHGEME